MGGVKQLSMTALTAWAALFESVEPDITVDERLRGRSLHSLMSPSGAPRLLASRGLTMASRPICASAPRTEGPWTELGTLAAPWLQRVAAKPSAVHDWGVNALVAPPLVADVWLNAVRAGVVQAVALPSGTHLAALRGSVQRLDPGGDWTTVLRLAHGVKPARGGLLADTQGRVWLAEYTLNHKRTQTIQLWRSRDDGRSFEVAHAFDPGAVRHLHFIQQDPIDGSLWIGSGDSDRESGLWRSTDGERWQQVGGGSQLWRAIGLAFLPDAVVWGTDAGLDAPHFKNVAVRFDRASGALTTEAVLQGPVHGVTALPTGRVALATGCEGGANETDGSVHLWLRSETGHWREVAQWVKGPQPARMQYAVAHFVPGQVHSLDLWVQLRGTMAMPLGAVRLRLSA